MLDFMYEHDIQRCPITEEEADVLLKWIGIHKASAMEYSGLSSSRALLLHATKAYQRELDPFPYQSV